MSAPTFRFFTTSESGFSVVAFTGSEGLSQLFRYEIDLKIPAATDSIDEDALLDEMASFEWTFDNQTTTIQGVLAALSFTGEGGGYHYYQAVLVPEWWKDTLGRNFCIFKDMSVGAIINNCLPDSLDALSETYPAREFACQFAESNFNFISRLTEHYGIYYYFDHSQQTELIFADDAAYESCPGLSGDSNYDSAASGDSIYSSVTALRRTRSRQADYITVLDNDPDQPSQAIVGTAGMRPDTTATEVHYMDQHVEAAEEANTIAAVRLEEVMCQSDVYQGESGVPLFRPGFTFSLAGHSKAAFNQAYLLTRVDHEGSNLDAAASDGNAPSYRNSFQGIPASNQYRPPRLAECPKADSVRGWVHSATDNTERAERDADGRYKVRFIFSEGAQDLGDTSVDTSHYLRMQQPLAGGSDVFDLPLPGGVEVNICFVDNNPDRPYIDGALYDAGARVRIASQNTSNAVFETQGLYAQVAHEGRYTYNIARSGTVPTDPAEDAILAYPKNNGSGVANYYSDQTDEIASRVALPFAAQSDINEVTVASLTAEQEVNGNQNIDRTYGDSFRLINGDIFEKHNGNVYGFGNSSAYNLGNGYEENFVDDTAPLNTRLVNSDFSNAQLASADLLEGSGPVWGSLQWPVFNDLSESEVNPGSHGDTTMSTALSTQSGSAIGFKTNPGGAWDSDGLLVSKTFGESYEYVFGGSVSVADRVHSMEMKYMDENTAEVEMVFLNGNLRQWSRFKNGEQEEKKWTNAGKMTFHSIERSGYSKEVKYNKDGSQKVASSETNTYDDREVTTEYTYDFNTGGVMSYSTQSNTNGGLASMEFAFQAKSTASFEFGFVTSFSLSADATIALELSASAATNIKVSASADIEITTGPAVGIEIDARIGGVLKMKPDGSFETEMVGLNAELKSPVEIAVEQLTTKVTTLETKTSALSLTSDKLKVAADQLAVKAGIQINI